MYAYVPASQANKNVFQKLFWPGIKKTILTCYKSAINKKQNRLKIIINVKNFFPATDCNERMKTQATVRKCVFHIFVKEL